MASAAVVVAGALEEKVRAILQGGIRGRVVVQVAVDKLRNGSVQKAPGR